jgi:hypothetical protein
MSLEEKQQYLNSEIIQQNYDGNEFSAFISSIRGEQQVDLDTWSFEDLQAVVAQFKAQYQQTQANQENQNEQNVNNEEQNQNQTQEESQNQENSPENGEEQKIEKKPSSENDFPENLLDPLTLVIKTQHLQLNEISDNNDLFITISNPQRVKPGLLSIAYFQYDMETQPVGYKVVRKVSDYTFLYETLPLINCAVFNPILPHFEFGLKDDSPKKMLYIQNYMNSLIENKFFRTLPIVLEFLTLDQPKWNSKRTEYQKLKTLPLSKMPTLEGELDVNINKEEDAKALKIKEEINKKTEALDAVNSTMDEILALYDKLNLLYKNLAKSFMDLEKAHENNQILNGFFNRLKSLSEIWSKDYTKQKELLKDDFKYFFKFINKENVSYLRKFEEFRVTREDYRIKYEKLKKLPVRQPKDLEVIKTLRVEYGMQLLMVNKEYHNLLERQAYRCLKQFMKYNENQQIILQDYENCRNLFNINQQQDNNNEGNEEQNQEVGENN